DNFEPQAHVELHSHLNGLPCDKDGSFLPEDAPPPPWDHPLFDDFFPYEDRPSFELADILFRRDQMSASNIDDLMQVWGARHTNNGPPFCDKQDLYDTIDSTPIGGVPWQSFSCQYDGLIEDGDAETAPWKFKQFDIWYRDPRLVIRNQLGNPDFKNNMDFCAKRVFDANNKRCYENFMSGNWAWRHSDTIAEDPATHGATFCPIILGSDKTTVSVATGHTEYYPLYISNGLIHNNVRRAHQNGLTLVAFLAIPK
ncbi:hypothetical protein H0H92_012797, partial [Tricholoma furcatifolium]